MKEVTSGYMCLMDCSTCEHGTTKTKRDEVGNEKTVMIKFSHSCSKGLTFNMSCAWWTMKDAKFVTTTWELEIKT